MPISASAMRLIMRQVHEIATKPVPGVQIIHNDDNTGNSNNNSSSSTTDTLSELHVNLTGPEETPFAGGLFHVVLYFDEGYPSVPPRGLFRTKIFHPNVSEKGDICVNVLKRDWDPGLGLRHVITVIRCLLIEPNAESALNEEAARLLLEDYDAFRRKAEMMTKVHAMRGIRPQQQSIQSIQQQGGRGGGDPSHALGVDLYNTSSQQQQQQLINKEDLSTVVFHSGVVDAAAAENGVGVQQLRNAPDSALNLRNADNGNSTLAVNSKKAVDKKRAALKRI
ncbi:ubiquitin-conjugating enzyme [Trypanosoma theileri]|uniref:Ubiquitin-conjugating enzyme n=1 Tax=Trypanosoma theileri TaxID=67003 RepID=A0A1X0NSR5_9TRYP|nr:ubiquitin-conjugating enzyme [Trypanosoma theileri]ORC87229.1 ubiquitin-conjugating enzyme [Trypanosoma theileri]